MANSSASLADRWGAFLHFATQSLPVTTPPPTGATFATASPERISSVVSPRYHVRFTKSEKCLAASVTLKERSFIF